MSAPKQHGATRIDLKVMAYNAKGDTTPPTLYENLLFLHVLKALGLIKANQQAIEGK